MGVIGVGKVKKLKNTNQIPPLSEYAQIVGEESIEELRELAEEIKGVKLQEINSARYGGGVAEILLTFIPFMKMLGIEIRWDVIEANPSFFQATKTLHNFLQGREVFSISMARKYWETLWKNKEIIDKECNIVTIHDPQPMGLIEFLDKVQETKIIWRCHIHLETYHHRISHDFSRFIKDAIEKFDAAIFSTFQFLPLWNIPSFVVPPFIDPLSKKNKELPLHKIEKILAKYEIDQQVPLITQVSRFDMFKDPLGVIGAYKMIRGKTPCQLLLAGGSAADDPEYAKILKMVQKKAEGYPNIHVVDLPPDSHEEINAFQRASQVIIQKSIKEGFGLTVAESLWKGKPVIGGAVGGITLQIKDEWNGFLVSTVQETAEKILYLLRHPEEAQEMGQKGKEFVAEHFLLTRGIRDHLKIINQLRTGKIVDKNAIISYHPWYGPK